MLSLAVAVTLRWPRRAPLAQSAMGTGYGPRRATAVKSALADLEIIVRNRKNRFRLAAHPSRRGDGAHPRMTENKPRVLSQQSTRPGLQNAGVPADEAGRRADRFLQARTLDLSFARIQRAIRKGEVRVDGKRVDANDRVEPGQIVRIPPLHVAPALRLSGDEGAHKT